MMDRMKERMKMLDETSAEEVKRDRIPGRLWGKLISQ